MKKLVLIDSNALIHRAFHALPPLTSPKGVVTNAVFGFSSILLRMIKELKPDYMAAAFDLAGPTFRHEQFKEYKAHREKAPNELYSQIPLVKEVLTAFGVPVFEKEGYEADDLIGSLASKAKKNVDVQTVIASGDLDTLQLVDDKKVVVFTLRKGIADTVMYNEDTVLQRYGFGPEQVVDYKGLKGDPSDNIPGVPGVGEKTASELIKTFGNLENLYQFLKTKSSDLKALKNKGVSPKLAEKLIENEKKAIFSKQLATIVIDLDIDFSFEKSNWQKNMDRAKVETVFRDLGFSSLIKRIDELGLTSQSKLLELVPVENTEKANFDPDKNNYYIVSNNEKEQKEILKNRGIKLVGYDLKSLYKSLITSGKHISNSAFDLKMAAYLLNPDVGDYDFEKIYYSEFGNLPTETVRQKPVYFWQLKERLWEKIKSAKLIKVFESIEMPLIPVLAEMELNGIKIDTPVLDKLLKKINGHLLVLEKKIYKLAGSEFNINSPQQLGDVLYNKLQIKGRVRRTGGGALSTAAPELEKLREEHPIIDFILRYRELQKLKTTYIEPFPQLANPKDGRIHTTYNQAGTGTGRLSSENPNLQNIPVKTELGQEFRKAFVSENGYKLVSFDYSQLELRIAAHVAKDKKMIEAFRRGQDIHTATAAEIFDVPLEKVTKEMRRQAKTLNFGIIYGMGPVSFARSAGVTIQRAKEFITEYFADFSGITDYMEKTKDQAHKNGYVETIFGRRRLIPDIYSTMPQIQAQSERMAINHPIQGTAADLMKLAMISCHDFIHPARSDLARGRTLRDGVRLLLQVHDELVFEIKDELVKKVAPEIKKIMELVHQLDAPLVVDVKYGNNWQEMKSF